MCIFLLFDALNAECHVAPLVLSLDHHPVFFLPGCFVQETRMCKHIRDDLSGSDLGRFA